MTKPKNGWLMMPTVKNIPEKVSGWIKTTCPDCGQPCWMRKEDEQTIQDMNLEGATCTDCALKKWSVYDGKAENQ